MAIDLVDDRLNVAIGFIVTILIVGPILVMGLICLVRSVYKRWP